MATQREWPLTDAVLILAHKAQQSRDQALATAGRQAEARLRQPLHAALVGLVSAGKSTLLNALLETDVAPTAGGECTRVLYAFRHRQWKTATVIPRDGTEPTTLPFEDSRLSSDLPRSHAEIDRVEVTLPADLLEQVTLLDTPGIASTNADTSAVTRELLENDTLNAARAADAIIFCINTPLKDSEAEAVRLFRSGKAGLRLNGGTAVAVLTKVDLPTGGDGSLPDRRATMKRASDLAHSLSTLHADLFSDVLPVIGLLAATARTGVLREHHARSLKALALQWSQETAREVLIHEQLFYEERASVEVERRRELVELLGLYGIEIILDELRAGAPATAAVLAQIALRASGFEEMNRRLRIQLGSRADVLKSGAQLNILMSTAQAAGDRSVYSAAQELLDKPEMFELKVLGLASLLASGRVRPPPPPRLADEAWTLLTTGLPRVSSQDAALRAREWREWATLAGGEGNSVMRIMVRAWQLAAQGR